ncbi:regulatory protein RecX [Sphingomicrobium nitratireducens]|uniref:regulatory protein RecX n=1 Tax=Sphingomicrobium nitratireducens TaxID=2964666 RepID=UPI00223F3C53|nr:RecX family transcriptional regulator [Sphingomicrobium nitratireducens]
MTRNSSRRRAPRPLDEEALEALALHYVGRYATSRAKLLRYLSRKIAERGWAGARPADADRIADRFVELGYVDDAAFAASRARSLASRGYGKRRLDQQLYADGIADEQAGEARRIAEQHSVEAALHFARRKRVGPYASERPDPARREKAIASMLRAGHPFALVRAIVDLAPGEEPDHERLAEAI